MTQPVPPPSATEVQALFNQIAPAYDQLNDTLSLGLHHVWKQMTVKWANPTPGSTCLDVCCGSGDVTQLLAKAVGCTGQVYGLDFSAAQLAVARSRHHPHYFAPVTWLEGDALQLPFESDWFDAITMSYGLRNLGDIPRSLSELQRVLKPGATVAILDFHRPENAIARRFQVWYLQNLVVPAATRCGLRDEYAYISESLDRFPVGREQVGLATAAGFERVVHYPIAGGVMGVLVATKGG